jgi:hypothetical protein
MQASISAGHIGPRHASWRSDAAPARGMYAFVLTCGYVDFGIAGYVYFGSAEGAAGA